MHWLAYTNTEPKMHMQWSNMDKNRTNPGLRLHMRCSNKIKIRRVPSFILFPTWVCLVCECIADQLMNSVLENDQLKAVHLWV